ncbi:restriction endonuclease subunit S [Mesotoga sp. B105.6.4]|uniref:restriction endonuclease subunit S n=1 Tax=Mesotoga sp. B105.6.4 TaxID=1582224 RepID=UPI000CCC85DD|nr:restriction endonuclease subunit S [Mesotoga sp. B105.6.4]
MSEEITKDLEKIVPKRWKRYPRYKDSGVEWIGEIPEGWGVEKLKYLALITMGQSPNSENCNTSGKGIPFLQGNADFGPIHPTANNFCTSFQKTTKAGEVLLSVRAPVGEVNIADQEYAIGRGLCSLDPVKLNRDYLVYFLQSCRPFLMSISTGSTFDAISVSDVRELMLPSTQNEEQERISRFLNRVIFKTDTLISKKQRLIELLKEKRAAIITRAVTKGLDPNAPMKDSGIEWIGEMPKHWNIGLIKQGYQVTLGKMLQPNKRSENDFEAPYLRSANIQDGFVDTSEIKTMYFNKSEDHLLLEEGDLLVCEGGDVGRAAIWSNQVSNCRFQNSINRIRSKTNSVRYLFYLLKASKRSGFIDFLCNRATISHFTAEKVKGLRIVYPDMTEQLKIANYLDKETSRMNSFISKIEKSIELLKEYRSALITAAVTGKIDVREEVP